MRLNLEVGRLESRDSKLFEGIELRAGAARVVFGDGDSYPDMDTIPWCLVRVAREN